MLVEMILTNGAQYSGFALDDLADKYCQVFLDKSVRGEIISSGLSDRVLAYGAKDVKYLPEIKRKQLGIARDLDLLKTIDLENSFVIALSYVEYCGIKLDYQKWKLRTYKTIDEVIELKKELEAMLWKDKKYKYFSGMIDMFTGEQECIINWDSPTQVIKLFKEYSINTILKVKGIDKETIDAKVLEPQADKFPILPIYLKYKGLQKVVSTYGLNWAKYINKDTSRIHTKFNQIMDTARLSCGGKDERSGSEYPNLQNIPSDEETRSCFIPDKGNVFIDADYSSQEQIVLANFSKEENLINFYKKGFKDRIAVLILRN